MLPAWTRSYGRHRADERRSQAAGRRSVSARRPRVPHASPRCPSPRRPGWRRHPATCVTFLQIGSTNTNNLPPPQPRQTRHSEHGPDATKPPADWPRSVTGHRSHRTPEPICTRRGPALAPRWRPDRGDLLIKSQSLESVIQKSGGWLSLRAAVAARSGHALPGAVLVGAAVAGQGQLAITRAVQGQLDTGQRGVPDGTVSSARVGVRHRDRGVIACAYRQLKPGSRRGDAGGEPARAGIDPEPPAQPAQQDPLTAEAERAHRGPRRPRRADLDPGEHQVQPRLRRGTEARGVQPYPRIGVLGSPVVTDGPPPPGHADVAAIDAEHAGDLAVRDSRLQLGPR
jgi:hypothetical protein